MDERNKAPIAAMRDVARGETLGEAVRRGADAVTRVSDAALEALRTYRDPVNVVTRRKNVARFRFFVWLILGLVVIAAGVSSMVALVGGDHSVSSIGGSAVALGLGALALVGAADAARDWRQRVLLLRTLPAAQPARSPVAGAIRPLIQKLDRYSDALRHSVGAIGIDPHDEALRALRADTLSAADSAETRLRQQAAEFTALVRAHRGQRDTGLAASSDRLRRAIEGGVDEYGRLVAAASDAAAATRQLAQTVQSSSELAESTDQLSALASAMRELARRGTS